MKSKQPKVKPLTSTQRVEWHAQKLAESFSEFDRAMCRCWKILGSVTMTCEKMRDHAMNLQLNSKDGRKKCK